jgi:CheY-like chemotaxis protein
MRRDVPVVLVIDSSEELVTMLTHAIEQAGLLAVSLLSHQIRNGSVDLEAFVRQHRPAVITYDIAPPYASDYALLRHIRTFPQVASCPFVLTSPNVAQLRGLLQADEQQSVHEIVGKPHDIGEYVGAVMRAARFRPED